MEAGVLAKSAYRSILTWVPTKLLLNRNRLGKGDPCFQLDVIGALSLGQSVLGQKVSGARRYGAQRLWGTVHWGRRSVGHDAVGHGVVGHNVTGAKSLGQKVMGLDVLGQDDGHHILYLEPDDRFGRNGGCSSLGNDFSCFQIGQI